MYGNTTNRLRGTTGDYGGLRAHYGAGAIRDDRMRHVVKKRTYVRYGLFAVNPYHTPRTSADVRARRESLLYGVQKNDRFSGIVANTRSYPRTKPITPG